jgi:hypothetical protein
VGFAATVTLSLLARLAHGAPWSELAAGWFHEVLPARGLLWLVYGLAWAANVLTIVIFVLKGLALLFGDSRPPALIITVIVAGLLAWPCYKLRKLFAAKVIDVGLPESPALNLRSVNVTVGVEQDEFLRLGSERFPNHINPDRAVDARIRWGLLLGGMGLALLFLYLAAQQSEGPKPPRIGPPGNLAAVGLLLAYAAGVLLLMFLANHRDYMFVPFRLGLLVEGGLGVGMSVGILLMGAKGQLFLVVVAVTFGAVGVRAGADLHVARVYDRMKRTVDPIAEDIRGQVPDLNHLQADPNFQQPPLQADALATRLARGCQNVEEKGPFVTRHFARFLDVVDLRTHDCVMAQLRFLTVRRYVTLTGGVGTYDRLQYPIVPVWNENLFPVHPPTGFVNWIDSLLLRSKWDVVVTCGRCGGTGQVRETYQEARTEYYTDHEGRSQTRTVYDTKERWVTCPSCGGSGRLLHSQVLNTQWQRLQPTVTGPEMLLPELVEDAEEVTFVDLPVKEDRRPLPMSVKVAAPACSAVDRLTQAAHALAARHSGHAAAVEQLHDGVVYRADFRVCGFRTVRMAFRNLAGRIGWFFGKRPEFYFPRLPLSWGAVTTGVFLPPLGLLAGRICFVDNHSGAIDSMNLVSAA